MDGATWQLSGAVPTAAISPGGAVVLSANCSPMGSFLTSVVIRKNGKIGNALRSWQELMSFYAGVLVQGVNFFSQAVTSSVITRTTEYLTGRIVPCQ